MTRYQEPMPVDWLATRFDDRNPKTHADGVTTSMSRLGFIDPVILDERTQLLVAGHGRIQALRDLAATGAPPPEGITVDVDGSWLVPVSRGWASTSDEQAGEALIGLNRWVEVGGWNPNALIDLLGDITDLADTALIPGPDLDRALAATGYTGADLLELIDQTRPSEPEDRSGDDDVPEPPVVPISAPGDVWLLGDHRVICGDSTDPTVVDRLMAGDRADLVWTDPPYGVAYVGKTKQALTIKNDKLDATALTALLRVSLGNAMDVCRNGAVWFVAAPPGPLFLSFAIVLTLIASDKTGRVARLVELDPCYVDVICHRFEQATGIVPVLDGTGPRSFTAPSSV